MSTDNDDDDDHGSVTMTDQRAQSVEELVGNIAVVQYSLPVEMAPLPSHTHTHTTQSTQSMLHSVLIVCRDGPSS